MSIDGSVVTSAHRVIPFDANPESIVALNLRRKKYNEHRGFNRKSMTHTGPMYEILPKSFPTRMRAFN